MIFNFKLFDIGKSSSFLFLNIVTQLRAGEHFLLILHDKEVGRFHIDNRVYPVSFGDFFFQAVQLAYHVVMNCPFMNGGCIIRYTTCCQVRNQFLVDEFIQRETVACFHGIIIIVNVCNDTAIHFQLYVACRILFLGFDIPVFKVQAGDASFRDYVRT